MASGFGNYIYPKNTICNMYYKSSPTTTVATTTTYQNNETKVLLNDERPIIPFPVARISGIRKYFN